MSTIVGINDFKDKNNRLKRGTERHRVAVFAVSPVP